METPGVLCLRLGWSTLFRVRDRIRESDKCLIPFFMSSPFPDCVKVLNVQRSTLYAQTVLVLLLQILVFGARILISLRHNRGLQEDGR